MSSGGSRNLSGAEGTKKNKIYTAACGVHLAFPGSATPEIKLIKSECIWLERSSGF